MKLKLFLMFVVAAFALSCRSTQYRPGEQASASQATLEDHLEDLTARTHEILLLAKMIDQLQSTLRDQNHPAYQGTSEQNRLEQIYSEQARMLDAESKKLSKELRDMRTLATSPF